MQKAGTDLSWSVDVYTVSGHDFYQTASKPSTQFTAPDKEEHVG